MGEVTTPNILVLGLDQVLARLVDAVRGAAL
jgi:hypothetical protein